MSPEGSEPARRLGPAPALALVAGSMLGIGIFISPHEVAAHVDGMGPFFVMWALGGVSALCGALSLAELGAMIPKSGGDYAYLRRSWGGGIAFAAGWLQLLAIFPGSLASVAVATSQYQLPVLFGQGIAEPVQLLGLTIPASHLWAAALIVGLTVVNHIGVRLAGWLQVVVTGIPLLVLLLASLAVLGGAHEAAPAAVESAVVREAGLAEFARAYLAVYFAYSGWNAAIFVGGEIEKPGRNLPRALVGGTLLVTALYIVLCGGFVAIFGIEGLAGVGEAGTASAQALFGGTGILLVTGLILLAMLGSLNGTVLTGSRIAYAMARKGDCHQAAGTLHRRFGTPVAALWLQAVIALALLLAGPHLDTLIAYTSSAMLITGTLTVLSVMVLRRKLPDMKRPYRVSLYPVPPILYAVSSVAVLVIVGMEGDPSVWVAGGWFAAALVVYAIRKSRSASTSRSAAGNAG